MSHQATRVVLVCIGMEYVRCVTAYKTAVRKRAKDAAYTKRAERAQKSVCVTRYILVAGIVQVRVRSLLCLSRVWVRAVRAFN